MGKFNLDLLKKNSETQQKEIVEANSKKNYGEGYFKLVADKNKPSQAIVRFIPYSDSKLPYVKHGAHFFKKDSMWIIAECPAVYSNYKEKCPLCEANKKNFDEAAKDIYQQRKAKINYLVNAYIVEDKMNPENNGTVKMMELTPAVWKIIQDSMSGEFEEPSYPFSVYDGNAFNMVLTYKKENGFFSYEKSKFLSKRESLAKTDKEIEAILEKTKDLDEIIQQKLANNGDLQEKADIAWDNIHIIGSETSESVKESSNKPPKTSNSKPMDADPFGESDDDLSSVFGSEDDKPPF